MFYLLIKRFMGEKVFPLLKMDGSEERTGIVKMGT